MFNLSKAVCVAALCLTAPAANAIGITDPAGDLLGTFAGSASSTDLDVISASVTYDPVADLFVLRSTQVGNVGATPGGFYVWGVNRGAGTAGFAPNGITGVFFDRVVLLRPDGTGTIPGVGPLPAGSVIVSGNEITGTVSGSLLISTGFAKSDYTWNLWPRDSHFVGFAAISDFAPDNSNFAATTVPEPGSMALLTVGLGLLGWRRWRTIR